MHKLNIELGSCVRVASKFSECTKCADICPTHAISYNENILTLDDNCIDCGGCIGTCPTEAISLSNFNTLDFIFDYLKYEQTLISCKKNIPCLATLSVENLISLAILNEDNVLLDIGHCQNCNIREPLFNQILQNVDEANTFLADLNTNKTLLSQEIAYKEETISQESENRRDFLKKFTLKGAIESKVAFEHEIKQIDQRGTLDNNTTSKLKQKSLPNKRKLLFMALKRIQSNLTTVEIPSDRLSFISQKSIDHSCDNCSFCYRICPTGALSSDRRGTKIDFDALSCVKCHLCHDVCQSDSIHLKPFNTVSIYEPKVEELIKFNVIRCDECGNFFTYLGGEENICPRCKIEEEEAKSLWGIQ